MLTNAEIEAMTPETRTELFESLCATLYGPKPKTRQIAEELGISIHAPPRWKRENSVPAMALLLLDHKARLADPLGGIGEDVKAFRDGLSGALHALERLSARYPLR